MRAGAWRHEDRAAERRSACAVDQGPSCASKHKFRELKGGGLLSPHQSAPPNAVCGNCQFDQHLAPTPPTPLLLEAFVFLFQVNEFFGAGPWIRRLWPSATVIPLAWRDDVLGFTSHVSENGSDSCSDIDSSSSGGSVECGREDSRKHWAGKGASRSGSWPTSECSRAYRAWRRVRRSPLAVPIMVLLADLAALALVL